MLAVIACGSDGDPTGAGASGGGTTGAGAGGAGSGREPLVHRASAEMCTGERPPGAVYEPNEPGSECKADADCTAGANGRCVQRLGGPTRCSYDACVTDEDCGSGQVCACRNEPNDHANTCYHGGCRVDADCEGGAGWCSPSAVTLSVYCTTGVSPGSFGYFCHSAEDECVDDADCDVSAMQMCLFSAEKLRFACSDILCVN